LASHPGGSAEEDGAGVAKVGSGPTVPAGGSHCVMPFSKCV
jgi:hypothetical protein